MARRHDGTGRSTGMKRDRFAYNSPPSSDEAGGWIWLTREMLESSAWAAMPLAARKIVERIAIEHMAHAGTMNGELTVTYDDFVKFGIRRSTIIEAIAVAVGLGWVDVTVRGVRSYGTRRMPSQYGLTWIGRRDRTPPSNRWRTIDAARARQTVDAARSAGWRPKRSGKRTPSQDINSSRPFETRKGWRESAIAGHKNETGLSHTSATGGSHGNATREILLQTPQARPVVFAKLAKD